MLRPVRGSLVLGGCGESSVGEKSLKMESRSITVRARCKATSRCANLRLNTIGASLVVSAPQAIPLSIWPMAILAPMSMAACKLVPQACCMVMPGVVGASLVSMTASRARFQSRECETTAPPTTSPMATPASLYLSTSPEMAVDIILRLVCSAYSELERQNGMRLPPMIAMRFKSRLDMSVVPKKGHLASGIWHQKRRCDA